MEDNKNEEKGLTKNCDKKFKVVIGVLFVLLICAVVCIVLLLVNFDSNKNESDKKESSEVNDKIESKDEEKPLDYKELFGDMEHFTLNVTNINSKRNYKVELVKKSTGNKNNYNDGYSYAFYDITNRKYITEFKYANITCGASCVSDKNSIGCIENGVKLFSFTVNNKDYIYITYDINLCGGISSSSFIYDISENKIVLEDFNGRDEVKEINGEIIIKITYAGNDICGRFQICNGASGYLFSKDGKFEEKTGVKTFNDENKFYIFTEDNDLFNLNVYNEKLDILYTAKNIVSFSDNYLVTFSENGLELYDKNNKKIDNIDFEINEKDEFSFNPQLIVNENKITLEYYKNSNTSDIKQVYYIINR